MPLHRYVIERDVPDIGSFDRSNLAAAAAKSNAALKELAPAVHWEHSYVTGNKTFCVYVAENEDVIRRHAELSGFPATRITRVNSILDPTSESDA